jgi:hypothetical protein
MTPFAIGILTAHSLICHGIKITQSRLPATAAICFNRQRLLDFIIEFDIIFKLSMIY